jgi:hypothetical protein
MTDQRVQVTGGMAAGPAPGGACPPPRMRSGEPADPSVPADPGASAGANASGLATRTLVLAVTVVGLHLAGHGILAAPEPTESAVTTWASKTPPLDVAFAGLRLGALAIGLYLLVVVLVALLAVATGATVLGAAVALAPSAGAQPLAPKPPTLRRIGPSPVAGHLSPPPPATTTSGSPPTLRRVTPPASGPTSTAPESVPTTVLGPSHGTAPTTLPPTTHSPTTPAHEGGPPTHPPATPGHDRVTLPTRAPTAPTHVLPALPGRGLRRLGSTSPRSTPQPAGRDTPGDGIPRQKPTHRHHAKTTDRQAREAKPPSERRPGRATSSGESETTWVVVAPGDSFWSIASARVAAAIGGTPTTPQVARYWSRLIDANQDRLPVPGQPDLLFAGERLRTPPVQPDRTNLGR